MCSATLAALSLHDLAGILDRFHIVFVCTGNRFRSPLAEAFVRRLTLGLPVRVESLGTLEVDQAPPLPVAVELALACGIDLGAHRTRNLGSASIADADLVIGFDHGHVKHAVVDGGARRNRAFTFRELVRLLESSDAPGAVGAGEARQIVVRAGQLRESRALSPQMRDDIRDPFGRSRKVCRDTAAEIRELSIELARRLFAIAEDRVLLPIPLKIDRPFRRG